MLFCVCWWVSCTCLSVMFNSATLASETECVFNSATLASEMDCVFCWGKNTALYGFSIDDWCSVACLFGSGWVPACSWFKRSTCASFALLCSQQWRHFLSHDLKMLAVLFKEKDGCQILSLLFFVHSVRLPVFLCFVISLPQIVFQQLQ